MGYTLCDIAATNPFGRTAVGGAELCVSIRFALSAYAKETVSIGNVTARFSIQFAGEPAPRFLANAQPEAPIHLKTQPPSDPRAWIFSAFISTTQLAELETLRNGRELTLHVRVSAEGDGSQGLQALHAESSIEINTSKWAEVAPQLGGLDYVVMALPVPEVEGMRHVAKLLADARRALNEGRYDSVIGLCRQAIESYRKVYPASLPGSEAGAMFADKARREAMTRRQRLALIEASVRHLSHLAMHPDDDGAPETFSRSDAVLALTAAIGVLSVATEDTHRLATNSENAKK